MIDQLVRNISLQLDELGSKKCADPEALESARAQLIADCEALRSEPFLTEEFWKTVNQHVQNLQELTKKSLSSRIQKDSSSDLKKNIEVVGRAFSELETVFAHRNSLDNADPSSLKLFSENRSAFHQLCHLAASGHARAQKDLRQLVQMGDKEALDIYCSHILRKESWVMEGLLEFADQVPALLEKLAEKLQSPFIFELFLELSERQNPFAIEYLSREVFSDFTKFSHFLNQYSQYRMIKNLRIVLRARIPSVQISFFSDEDRKFVEHLSKWRSLIPPINESSKAFLYSKVFQGKVLLAELLRQQKMIALLTQRNLQDLPSSTLRKDFLPTACWLVGIPECELLLENDIYLAQRLAELGREHNIEVIAGSPECNFLGVRSTPQSMGNWWIQDNQAWSIDRGCPVVRTSAITPYDFNAFYLSEIRRDRQNRGVVFPGALGSVHRKNAQLKALLFSDVAGIPCAINPCFTEEGNSLTGIDGNGNPYVVIGRDTVAWIRKQVWREMRDIGYVKRDERWIQKPMREPPNASDDRPSDEDLKLLLAHNYGVEPAQIFFCEQPGEYHLDVAMKLIGPKTVLINDSVQAAQQMVLMVQEEQALDPGIALRFRNQASQLKDIEDMAARDLENQGFTVIRFGGKTYHPLAGNPESQQINLFNFLSSITPGGKKLVVAMGCPPVFQEEFRAVMDPYIGEDGVIEFLDENWSQYVLSFSGGVECMTKPLPMRLRLR